MIRGRNVNLLKNLLNLLLLFFLIEQNFSAVDKKFADNVMTIKKSKKQNNQKNENVMDHQKVLNNYTVSNKNVINNNSEILMRFKVLFEEYYKKKKYAEYQIALSDELKKKSDEYKIAGEKLHKEAEKLLAFISDLMRKYNNLAQLTAEKINKDIKKNVNEKMPTHVENYLRNVTSKK